MASLIKLHRENNKLELQLEEFICLDNIMEINEWLGDFADNEVELIRGDLYEWPRIFERRRNDMYHEAKTKLIEAASKMRPGQTLSYSLPPRAKIPELIDKHYQSVE
jgi:hypothetical protein